MNINRARHSAPWGYPTKKDLLDRIEELERELDTVEGMWETVTGFLQTEQEYTATLERELEEAHTLLMNRAEGTALQTLMDCVQDVHVAHEPMMYMDAEAFTIQMVTRPISIIGGKTVLPRQVLEDLRVKSDVLAAYVWKDVVGQLFEEPRRTDEEE